YHNQHNLSTGPHGEETKEGFAAATNGRRAKGGEGRESALTFPDMSVIIVNENHLQQKDFIA
ncbi:MAG: hypothetical protein ACUVSH_04875, partial [Anaerolineae bacterium]